MSKTQYKTWEKAVLIPITELVFTDWNCNVMTAEKQAELIASIENTTDPNDPRFDEPLQVVPVEGMANKWLVLGGEHRTKAMTALNQTHIPCVIREDLAGKSRKDLMLYSVRRNNLRGRLDAQKYAELEDELVNDHEMSVEAARQTMLVEDDLANALRASINATKAKDDDDDGSKDYDNDFDKDGQQDEATKQRDQAELLNALRTAEQNVLLDSADTVEHGYLFFVQGSKGQMHLVVDESKKLHELVSKMVNACKGSSAKVDDFLAAAINSELQNWE